MALCIDKELCELLTPKEPEQDFYDCWKRVASEIKKNASNRAEEFEDNDDLYAYSAKSAYLWASEVI